MGKRSNIPRYVSAPLSQFCVENDILYFKSVNAYGKTSQRLCVPTSYQKKALIMAHQEPLSGHCGIQGTMEHLKKFAYWPTIWRDTKEFVKSCKVCALTKLEKAPKIPIFDTPDIRHPWARVNMDLVGPMPATDDGNRYILTVIDCFTKYELPAPIPNKSAPVVARALIQHMIGPFGRPAKLYNENGSEFVAEVFREVVGLLGINQKYITAFHPSASGQVEKFNSVLIKI